MDHDRPRVLTLEGLTHMAKNAHLSSSRFSLSVMEETFVKAFNMASGAPEKAERQTHSSIRVGGRSRPAPVKTSPTSIAGWSWEDFVTGLLLMAVRWAELPGGFAAQLGELLDRLQPLAGSAEAECGAFGPLARAPKVRVTLARHELELRGLFSQYCAVARSSISGKLGEDADDSDEAEEKKEEIVDPTASGLRLSSFRQMLQRARLIQGRFNESTVSHIFDSIQDHGDGPEESGGSGGLSFNEFLDGLIAVCLYWNPSPFVPLERRLDTFLVEAFLPRLSGEEE